MPKIKVNDINMYYEIHGKGEPIVLIGGFSADNLIWGGLVELLKSQFQVIVFDNRGAGQTDVPQEKYTISQMANDVVTLCENLGIKQAHCVGNSMGGFIVQELAHKYPAFVKSAIISNSTMNVSCCFHIYVSAQLELLKANAPLKSLIKSSSAWAFSFQFLSQPGMLDKLIQMTLDKPYPFTIPGYEGQYAALEKFDSTNWAAKITRPTLVVTGDEDLIFSAKSAKSLADKIPNAKFISYKQCGHLPMVEVPEAFASDIQNFIAAVE